MKLTKAERAARQALKATQPPPVKVEKTDKPRIEPVVQAAAPPPRRELIPVPIERWRGCYDESWKGFITPESFAHPAKAGRALLQQIYDRLFAIGALKTGGTVVDPFGGIGTTGIIGAWRKVQVLCHELEPKFVSLAKNNVELHRAKWEMIGAPIPRIVQGDSRQLRRNIREASAVIGSPPYSEGLGHGGTPTTGGGKDGDKVLDAMQHGYGREHGQLTGMTEGSIDTVISSPPYVAPPGHDTGHPRLDAVEDARREAEGSARRSGYGETNGNIAHLDEGNIDAVVSVDAVISSPPFQDTLNREGEWHKSLDPQKNAYPQQRSDEYVERMRATEHYGNEPGQLGAMDPGQVDAVIASPPYADQPMNPGDSSRPEVKIARLLAEGKYEDAEKIRQNYSGDASNLRQQDYGETAGQLGALPAGQVDAVVSSPPYVNDALGHSRGVAQDVTPTVNYQKAQVVATEYGTEPGQLDQLESGTVDAVIASPPYTQEVLHGRPSKMTEGIFEGRTAATGLGEYGKESGQLGAMDTGQVDAVIASPPYSSDQFGGGGAKHDKVIDAMKEGYGETSGQLGSMTDDRVDAVISSPPYESAISERGGRQGEIKPRIDPNTGKPFPQEHDLKPYGDTPGQLGSLPTEGVDAVLTSPPYNSNGLGASAQSEGPNGRPTENKGASQPLDQYGTEPGQLNHASEDTFWTAARDIVRECHAILKPGGVAVWIVKAFVRDKQIVDFPGDWRRLCEYIGFETELEVHAMLVKETEYTDVFGEERVQKKERKSFFRRLAESKGSPKIDHEVVYIMRKRA